MRILRNKILFSLFVVFVFRFLAHIPVPGVDISAIKSFINSSSILGIFDYFSGGGFQNFSIVTLGLSPYITASIIIQLMTLMIPALEELSKEGETGREKINQYTKYLTVPLSLFQSYGVYFLLQSQGVMPKLYGMDLMVLIASLVGGSMLLIWIGDLVTEKGIGNGISLLIFVGIISRLPINAIRFVATLTVASIVPSLIFILIALLVIIGVVLVNEGTRNIPLEYGRRGTKGQNVSNYLPIKVNQAGVIPIIFAVSIILLPSMVAPTFQASVVPWVQNIGIFLVRNFSQNNFLYNFTYFALVFGFTYFYTAVQFDPAKISEDIKKRGGFIPGVRPGSTTTAYLGSVITKLTLIGASFLGLVAVLPYIVQLVIGGNGFYSVGGTGLLIVVSVVLETVRQAQSLVVTKSYESYVR